MYGSEGQNNYEDHESADGPPSKRYRKDEQADPCNPEPSIVIHVRNLSPKATEADLLEALGHFGNIAYALVRRQQQMALVEFEDIEGATACVNFAATSQIYVAGQPTLFNYSTSHGIQRMGFECEKPNHVLVINISNVNYPISVDVLYEICAAHGQVLRINIVKRTHFVTALVEYPSADIAKTAKHAINGADIYSGCCTLKVEFARVDRVRINRHDQDQRDYTLPLNHFETHGTGRRPLMAPPHAPDGSYGAPGFGSNVAEYGYSAVYPPGYHKKEFDNAPYYGREGGVPPSRDYSRDGSDSFSERDQFFGHGAPHHAHPPGFGYQDGSQAYPEGGAGCVLMLYGIDQTKINCDMIFNMFCQYGNILRVKFMRAKVDTAMVEVGTPDQRENVIKYMNGIQLFGLQLEVKPSFQEGIREVKDPFEMPGGVPSYRDFSLSRNQRFNTPEDISRNRMSYPTNVLHWYNSPPEMDGEKITELFVERKASTPTSTHVFPSKSARSSSGTAEFESVEKANEALALSNHTPVVSPAGKAPFIVKMSYTFARHPTTSESGEGGRSTPDGEGSVGGESGGYRGRGRGRGRGEFRGGYRGRGEFRGRGRGRGEYSGQRDSYSGGFHS